MIDFPPIRHGISRGADLADTWKRWFGTLHGFLERLSRYDVSQFEQPNASGFSITVDNSTGILVLDPAAAYAAGTIVMPTDPENEQRLEISTSQDVTTMTFTTTSTILAPSGMTAGQGIAFIYIESSDTWFRVY